MGHRTFRVVLIAPALYDVDGYVHQWRRGIIESNSLGVVHGVCKACAEDRVLGDDVEIEISAYNESHCVVPIRRIIREIKSAAGGFVGLVGVHSSQFPRAMDIARSLREADVPVIAGGFHISGCLAMLPGIQPDLQAALDMGVTLFAGEAEERMADLLRDAYEKTLRPIYNFMSDLPDLAGAPLPYVAPAVAQGPRGGEFPFDAGRGCPFQCSFCSIINVQGRKSRSRSPDDVEAIVRARVAQGCNRFSITDDNFARNKHWEAILDRLIELRVEDGIECIFGIQVDVLCHRIPRFIEKCERAGVKRVFIGLENINPESLIGAKKRQNKIWEYRQTLQDWRNAGVITYAGYILGFPKDTPASIARDIEIIKRELPIDILKFFILTPGPGSEDHKKLFEAGVPMDSDMNKYDGTHVTTAHPLMSAEELQRAYVDAYDQYYSMDHIETVIRRATVSAVSRRGVIFSLARFAGSVPIEGVHPLELGVFRRKVRRQRRPSFPIESPLVFYPRRLWEVVYTQVRWLHLFWRIDRIRRKIKRDPLRHAYMDEALTPVTEGEEDHLELFKAFG